MERIDKPSDIEFAQAIVKNIPEPSDNKHMFLVLGAAYVASKVIKNAKKR
jgi:hypothetical protein